MESNKRVHELSTERFSDFISNEKLAVVDFYAEWCGSCMMMAPMIDNISEKHKEAKFGKMNVEKLHQSMLDNHNVCSLPCIIFFKNGKETDRITGPASEELMEEKIKSNLG